MIGAVWRVVWTGNDEPPSGVRVLAEKFELENSPYCRHQPPEITAAYPGVGHGYAVTWQPVEKPVQPLDQETLKTVRRKRLERRAQKKYPLFADQIVASEMERKPEYYNGITDPKIEADRQRIIEEENENLKRWLGGDSHGLPK